MQQRVTMQRKRRPVKHSCSCCLLPARGLGACSGRTLHQRDPQQTPEQFPGQCAGQSSACRQAEWQAAATTKERPGPAGTTARMQPAALRTQPQKHPAAATTHRARRTASHGAQGGEGSELRSLHGMGSSSKWRTVMHGCKGLGTHLDQRRPLAIVLGVKVVGGCVEEAAQCVKVKAASCGQPRRQCGGGAAAAASPRCARSGPDPQILASCMSSSTRARREEPCGPRPSALSRAGLGKGRRCAI